MVRMLLYLWILTRKCQPSQSPMFVSASFSCGFGRLITMEK